MKGDRYCQRCGEYLGNYMTDNFYALIRMKYCSQCRPTAELDFTAARMRKYRRTKREVRKAQNEQLELLKKENELLRKRIEDMREDRYE